MKVQNKKQDPNLQSKLLSSTVIPLFAVAAITTVSTVSLAEISFAASSTLPSNPTAVSRTAKSDGSYQVASCSACKPKKACNPCATKKACNPCNPCAAKKACNPCNPCATKKACNPCAPKNACGACNPCNPCAGGSAAALSQKCMVPRLMKASLCNPCAAKKACNPCAPKKACNPCAAKKACNPCNPCAAKKACNPCNPCAAKKACNPCAAKKACNPCNPCAAKKACNPCAPKNACGACNPCGGAAAPELTSAEATTLYDCLKADMVKGYAKSGLKDAEHYGDWDKYSTQPYVSDTHGGRFVLNYGNAQAKAYGKYEDSGRMPVGAKLAKDSFIVQADGKAGAGPLFLMEKMAQGFNKDSDDWRYTMVMPNGQLFGMTSGVNSAAMAFCYECHMAVAEDQDSMMFLPDEYRVK